MHAHGKIGKQHSNSSSSDDNPEYDYLPGQNSGYSNGSVMATVTVDESDTNTMETNTAYITGLLGTKSTLWR